MRQGRRAVASRRAAQAYTWLLRLYPRAHRQAFGEQMLQTFRDQYRDAVETHGERPSLFWLGVIRDAGSSLVTEHRAALGERRWPVRRFLLGTLVAGLAVIGLVAANLSARSAAQNPGVPMDDPIWRPVLELTMLLLTLGLYAALVAAIVLSMHNVVGSGNRPSQVRLGLTMGGIISLYAILVNVLAVVLPFDGYSGDQFLVLTLPLLLTGVVGVIGGYTTRTTRTGALAGLLAGVLYVLVSQLSWVLVVALAWPAIQHNLLSSGVQSDFQRLVQATGQVPDLGTFLRFELFEDGIGFPIITGLIGLALEVLCAGLGGAIGAAVSRADERRRQAAEPARDTARPRLPSTQPTSFLLAALALDLLVWITTVEFNALGAAHRLFGPGDLAGSFVNQTFGLWLLGFLAVLAFVHVGARLAPTRPKAIAAPG